MQTVCSENRQNLMCLFSLSGDHYVLIGVCVCVCVFSAISVLLVIVIVRVNWRSESLGRLIGRHFRTDKRRAATDVVQSSLNLSMLKD